MKTILTLLALTFSTLAAVAWAIDAPALAQIELATTRLNKATELLKGTPSGTDEERTRQSCNVYYVAIQALKSIPGTKDAAFSALLDADLAAHDAVGAAEGKAYRLHLGASLDEQDKARAALNNALEHTQYNLGLNSADCEKLGVHLAN
ncbi:hypothetical protein [Silvimonas amylolytica]|uniref:Uncharacterized protein n=1 Tax=Silvimonas amylolytica TaxID=449663 RepID=A0ABQ2PR35_9NEIS|nr:hypothetical protein [Silvimonas amylolytica]GGP27910.1 hypothetical protein GCM10010971_37290 [Silvimonas amylolytica]